MDESTDSMEIGTLFMDCSFLSVSADEAHFLGGVRI